MKRVDALQFTNDYTSKPFIDHMRLVTEQSSSFVVGHGSFCTYQTWPTQ